MFQTPEKKMKKENKKFMVGDKVVDKGGQTGMVVEVEKDASWAGGYRYLIDFGKGQGNQQSNGEGFTPAC